MSEIKKIKVNQVEYTLGNQEYADAIEALQGKVFVLESGAKVTLTANPTVMYKNETKTITLTAKVTGIDDTNLISELKITKGGNLLKSGNKVSGLTCTDSLTTTDSSYSYAVSAIINGVTLKGSATVSARYPMYIGFGETATGVTGNTTYKLTARTSCAGTYTIKNTSDNDLYVFILIPSDMTDLKGVIYGGIELAMDAVTTTTINGISYRVHKSSNRSTVREMTINVN